MNGERVRMSLLDVIAGAVAGAPGKVGTVATPLLLATCGLILLLFLVLLR
jgi:hypothetical protein